MRRSDAFTVTVRYHGNGKAPRSGLTGWRFGSDGGFACAAQASRADTFFPCNDHPSDKATWTFRLSASEGYVAAANAEPAGTTPAPLHSFDGPTERRRVPRRLRGAAGDRAGGDAATDSDRHSRPRTTGRAHDGGPPPSAVPTVAVKSCSVTAASGRRPAR
ncbi:hypothetical protein ACF06W_21515 [Streptomyces albus]|uniref:hypothetical protein n=1 Tax=Streptomyces albus TaxID=1888 RepID=UPI0036F7BA2D